MSKATKQKQRLMQRKHSAEFYKKLAKTPPKTRRDSFKEQLGHEHPSCLYCRTYSFAISRCFHKDHDKAREPITLCASHLLIGEGLCMLDFNTNKWHGHQVEWANLWKKEEIVLEVTARQTGKRKRKKRRKR